MRHLSSSVRESSFVTRLKQKDLIANRENICILSTFSFNLHDFIAIAIASALLSRQGQSYARTVPVQLHSIARERQRHRIRARGQTQEMRGRKRKRDVDANKRNINPWQLIIVF